MPQAAPVADALVSSLGSDIIALLTAIQGSKLLVVVRGKHNPRNDTTNSCGWS